MPEALVYENAPQFLSEFDIEPFREEYIPGSIILSRERGNGFDVYFQIPRTIAKNITSDVLDGLKNKIRVWWKTKVNQDI